MENTKTVSEQTWIKNSFYEYFHIIPRASRYIDKREKKKFGIGRDEGRAS